MNTTPTPPPLPRELDAFLAPHRTVSPLPPSVAARAMARAAATVEWSRPPAHQATLAAPRRWVFAATASAVVVAGAAAYAARAWIVAPSPVAPAPPHPPHSGLGPRGGPRPDRRCRANRGIRSTNDARF